MPLVSAHRISMHFGGPLLLQDLSLKIEPGDRVGMVGRNGCGKSTLLKMLAGQLEPSEGQIVRGRDVGVSYQAQELDVEPHVTVFGAMREVFVHSERREARLRTVEEELAATDDPAQHDRLLREYQRLHDAQERAGIYDVDQRIRSVLDSLGLAESVWHDPVGTFSGGERNVIGLARVLLAEPDVMLLDEPSNHLDMDGVEWFIDFLRRTKTAFVMVSHNRHLLDATVNEIWEMERRTVTPWTGSYGDFQRQKAEALARQQRQFKVQQRLIRRIEFQARRLMDMANAYDDPGQAKRAKAMIKRIDRMDKVEAPTGDGARFKAKLKSAGRHGRIALTVKDFSFSYDDRLLFDRANLEIEYGERVCLVGPNGSGKSTLFHEILRHGSWENPTLRLGKSVKVGEYSQLFDDLPQDLSLVDWAAGLTGGRERDAADLLYRFLFRHEDLDRPIATLSGGEKSRLQLARLVHEKVNFLLLDEPTNHLDIQSCELLEEMLLEYDGTLLIISHDRYFLDRLVGRVIELEDRQLADHPMTFAEWWRSRDAGPRGRALEDRRPPAEKAGRREAFEARKAAQREASRRRSRLRKLEVEIAELETRIQGLEKALETAWAPGGDPEAAERMARELAAARPKLEEAYDLWAGYAEEAGEDPA